MKQAFHPLKYETWSLPLRIVFWILVFILIKVCIAAVKYWMR